MHRTTVGQRVHVGEVFVDAGMIWVGDPCYVIGADASQAPKDWAEFCDRVSRPDNWRAGLNRQASEPLGEGIGLAVSSGYGDGAYPVYLNMTDGGTVASLTVEFINVESSDEDAEYDDDEDEDEYE